jgi:hypothetical protein
MQQSCSHGTRGVIDVEPVIVAFETQAARLLVETDLARENERKRLKKEN